MALILQTPRLLVREFSLADAPALQLICGNRRTMRHVGDGTTLDLARCTAWIRVSLRDYAGKGYGAWALFVQGAEPMAGYAGIVSLAGASLRLSPFAYTRCVWPNDAVDVRRHADRRRGAQP